MGSPSTVLTQVLYDDLRIAQNRALLFRVGNLSIRVPASRVSTDGSKPYSLGPDLEVEAMLPAGVLQDYQIVFDYQKRTISFAQPGTLSLEGKPVSFQIKKQTGLIAVDALIDGKPYAVTIDNGSAYTWFARRPVEEWLASHPGWKRGVGAVGASNMMMAGDGVEASGILLRIPEIRLGPLSLEDVGALAVDSGKPFVSNFSLFEWYSAKNPVPVIGWLGGNVLKSFRLMIDYPAHTMYWLTQTGPDAHDLNQVGLTLTFQKGDYLIAAIASKNGKPSVEGVQPGDKLLRVGRLETKRATWGNIYDAMHGRAGEVRTLLLQRGNTQLTVNARITAF